MTDIKDNDKLQRMKQLLEKPAARFVKAAVELAIFVLLGLWAIDSGSWLLWVLAIVMLVGSLQNVVYGLHGFLYRKEHTKHGR